MPRRQRRQSVPPCPKRRGRFRSRRLQRALLAAALAVSAIAGTAGWALGSEQTAVTGPPPGTAAWRADRVLGRPLPDPGTASPGRVAAFFAGLSPHRRALLVRRHPGVVGNLDGAPPALRYAANRRALHAEQVRARREAHAHGRTPEERTRARARARRCARLLAPGRHILAFDPRGRGQVAEVYGDLATAQRTAVVVPGDDMDLATFDEPGRGEYGRPGPMAVSLRARMAAARAGVRTAVIAWVGYTTPVGLGADAVTSRLADAGAPRLVRFLRGLAHSDVPAPAVFCHSYGSVLCAAAASGTSRRDARDLVLFASPGVHTDSVEGLHTPVRVWAARASGDWIGRVPHVRFLGVGHGGDPAGPGFGARIVTAGHTGGHAGYLAPGSAARSNFAAIALGSYAAVRCTRASQECGGG